MKKIAIYIVIATIAIMLWFFDIIDAHASEFGWTGNYPDIEFTTRVLWHFDAWPNEYYAIYYRTPDGQIPVLCVDQGDNAYFYNPKTGTSELRGRIFTKYNSDGFFHCNYRLGMGWDNNITFPIAYYPKNFDKWIVDGPLMVFDTLAHYNAWINYGFTDGLDEFNTEPPMPDWDDPEMAYDFSLDEYNRNIPIPEISQITYDSFYVKNTNLYGVDVLVDVQVNTIDVSKDGPYYFKDTGVAFKKNHYNFTQSTKQWFNNGLVDVKDMYGVDLAEWYLATWRELIATYPKYQNLPSFSWLKFGGTSGPSGYESIRNIDGNLNSTNNDVFKAMYAVPFQTTFYVRFYNPVNMDVGQWVQVKAKNNVKETLTDVGIVLEGKPQEIGLGSVEGTNASGKPIIKEQESYSYDWKTDNYEPKVTYETGDIEWDVSIENLRSVTSLFGQLPFFITAVFSFLPSWVTMLICSSITICCAMAIYHAIRG